MKRQEQEKKEEEVLGDGDCADGDPAVGDHGDIDHDTNNNDFTDPNAVAPFSLASGSTRVWKLARILSLESTPSLTPPHQLDTTKMFTQIVKDSQQLLATHC